MLAERTIFLCLAGSHAHGTAREGSDLDLRGVCVAPLSVRCSLFESFEQTEAPLPDALWRQVLPALRKHPTANGSLHEKHESVVFDIAKFLRLCCSANPNAFEILFADERDWLIATDAWAGLHAHRGRFLTRKVHETFVSYADAQLRRIKSHRSWLFNPPRSKPSRLTFGLPESATFSQDDQKRLELAEGGLPAEVSRTLAAERAYRGALKHWESYLSWKAKRNPKRAQLEERFGYDTKHAAHLIRLMRSGLEALETGVLLVRRADADQLVAIKDGAWPYERLLDEAELLTHSLADALAKSSLPEDVDRAWVDEVALSFMLGR